MSNTIVWADLFGTPVEIFAGWHHSGHDSLSHAEKDDKARKALIERAISMLEECGQHRRYRVFDVRLIRQENLGSETKKSWTGKRTHKAWGTGVGHAVLEAR